jgi:hypothetical protein
MLAVHSGFHLRYIYRQGCFSGVPTIADSSMTASFAAVDAPAGIQQVALAQTPTKPPTQVLTCACAGADSAAAAAAGKYPRILPASTRTRWHDGIFALSKHGNACARLDAAQALVAGVARLLRGLEIEAPPAALLVGAGYNVLHFLDNSAVGNAAITNTSGRFAPQIF